MIWPAGGYAIVPYGLAPYGPGALGAAVALAPHVDVPTTVRITGGSSSARIGG